MPGDVAQAGTAPLPYSRGVSQYPYPPDEFDASSDDGPAPIGVHRAPVPAWRAWLPLLAILVIVPLLAWGAVALLGSRAGDPSDVQVGPAQPSATTVPSATTSPTTEPTAEPTAAEATPTPEPTPEPPTTADLTTGVTVHNGTSTNGLAARTADRLTNAGYTSVTVAPGSYTETEPARTTVYYAGPEHAVTAQAAAGLLGITNVVQDPQMAASNPIVIVLRNDFTG